MKAALHFVAPWKARRARDVRRDVVGRRSAVSEGRGVVPCISGSIGRACPFRATAASGIPPIANGTIATASQLSWRLLIARASSACSPGHSRGSGEWLCRERRLIPGDRTSAGVRGSTSGDFSALGRDHSVQWPNGGPSAGRWISDHRCERSRRCRTDSSRRSHRGRARFRASDRRRSARCAAASSRWACAGRRSGGHTPVPPTVLARRPSSPFR